MNIQELISSGLLESYVLGMTSAEENQRIQEMCKTHPELNQEIESIENALMDYSAEMVTTLNPELKEKITKQLFEPKPTIEKEANIISYSSLNPTLRYYKMGIAASVLLLISCSIYILSLHQKLNRLNSEMAELTVSKSYLADELKVQQTSYSNLNSQFQIISNPKFKTIALNGMNNLANKSALVHWNSETDEVYFNAQLLPTGPTNKQYQLWAIVGGKPVDAGVIDLENGTVFQKMKLIKGAQAFAVTIENKGGSITPTLEMMCLLGNV